MHMKPRVALLAVAIYALPCLADEELDGLMKSFEDAQGAWFAKLSSGIEGGGEGAFDPAKLPPTPFKEFSPKFRAYAEKHSGKPDAVPALGWIIENAQYDMFSDPAALTGMGQPVHPDALWAIDRLGNHHAADPQMGQLVPSLQYAVYSVGRDPILKLMEQISEKNPDKNAQAGALFTQGAVLFDSASSLFALPGAASPDPAADKKRAVDLFKKVTTSFADSEYAKQAAAYLFEIENLQTGMKAPEIVGTDASGKEIKLSQFLGQVVLLDFWGFW